ncbi:hypothetical protein B0H19DRAFT_1077126 [Mycena capillaripes]|nr:hypothetical protein B0H19DRAFT_1077126 [Mycena capillaripes]
MNLSAEVINALVKTYTTRDMREQTVWLLRHFACNQAGNFGVCITVRICLLDLGDSLGVPKAGVIDDPSSVKLGWLGIRTNKLLNAPSAAIFWKEIKRLCDPAPIPISVTAESLRNVSEKRLNPPASLPESFDAFQHKINRMLARLIPKTTSDSSEEQFFSKEFTEEHMAWAKDQIRKHGLDSASGWSYHMV